MVRRTSFAPGASAIAKQEQCQILGPYPPVCVVIEVPEIPRLVDSLSVGRKERVLIAAIYVAVAIGIAEAPDELQGAITAFGSIAVTVELAVPSPRNAFAFRVRVDAMESGPL